MARKGELARDNATKIIADAFGSNFAAIQDKKIYVWVDDGGEKVQLAISLTMPKVTVGAAAADAHDWSNVDATTEVSSAPPAAPAPHTEMTAEDEAKVQELMKTLGIIP